MIRTTTSLFCLLLLYITAQGQVNLTDQLLLHYTFSGNTNDLSGNNVNATANGGPTLTTDRFGTSNSAYQFDGVDDYLEMAATTLTSTQFSYSLWAYPTSNSAISALLSVGSETENHNLLLSFTDGWIGGSYLQNGDNFSANTPTIPALNKWYHLVVVRNNNLIQLYVDGDSISSMDIPNVTAAFGTDPFANIGRRANTQSQYFTGKIDDVRIYGRVINDAEVEALFEETEVNPNSILLKHSLNFKVSPNPTYGSINVELPSSGNYEVTIYNSLGVMISHTKYSGISLIPNLSIEEQEAGLYQIVIKSSESMGVQKIVLSD